MNQYICASASHNTMPIGISFKHTTYIPNTWHSVLQFSLDKPGWGKVTWFIIYYSLCQIQFVEKCLMYRLFLKLGISGGGEELQVIGHQEKFPHSFNPPNVQLGLWKMIFHACVYLTLEAKLGHASQASVDAFDGTEWAQRGQRFVWWIGRAGIGGFLWRTAFIVYTRFHQQAGRGGRNSQQDKTGWRQAEGQKLGITSACMFLVHWVLGAKNSIILLI